MKKQTCHAPMACSRPSSIVLDAPALLAYLHAARKPRKLDDMLRALKLSRRSKKALQDLLWDMERAGDLTRLPGGTYVPDESLKQLTGVLELGPNGAAFVSPDSGRMGEVCIAPGNTAQAWRGDRVLVGLFPYRSDRNHEGKVITVLAAGVRELAARALRILHDGTLLCEPLDLRIAATFLTDASPLETAPERGDIVRIRVLENESPGLWKAVAVSLAGNEDTLSVQEDIVKANHGIATAFSEPATAEAASYGDAPSGKALSMQGRRDLTRLPFVTIDGEDARDFDDAIHVAREKDGFRLYVAIADVAHYVRPGSALDAEAYARGNSCYFPLSVGPMLPVTLSSGLCSLEPGVPRLVMVAEMAFDGQGASGHALFYPAYIVSQARLTYTQVRDGLAGGQAEAASLLGVSLPMLRDALALAHALAEARTARGSLDFELPEPRYEFGADGALTAITPSRGSFANRLIEEFMVAANEAVARFLTKNGVPFLYRVHPAPDPSKLKNLFSVVASTGLARERGIRLPTRPSARDLQGLLRAVKGTEREYVVGRLTLRSMMQAIYAPELEPHFGLASECYCHFTSPIRRYADLVVHRALKAVLAAPDAPAVPDRNELERTADHLRKRERAALEAEREIARRLGAIFLRDKIGETFAGVISGLTDFGVFVEFTAVMAEGMVRLSSLGDDYYRFSAERQELRGQRGGKAYHLGQQVRVKVVDVHPARQEITLVFDHDGGEEPGVFARPGRVFSAAGRRVESARPKSKRKKSIRSADGASGRGKTARSPRKKR